MSVGGKLAGVLNGGLSGEEPAPAFNGFVFDNGMGKPLRQIVVEGVIDLLQRMMVQNGGYLRAIEPTDIEPRGKFDRDTAEIIMGEMNGRTPGILVTTGDMPFQAAGSSPFAWRGELDVHLYALINSLRSRIARAAGDVTSAVDRTADPGAYTITEHMRMLLTGQRPGGTRGVIKELRPVSEIRLDGDGTLEIWHQVYRVRLEFTINGKRDLTQQLKQINASSRLAVDETETSLASTETVAKP